MIAELVQTLQNEDNLLEKIRRKDKVAFEKFYKYYYKRLYIVAFKYTCHHEQSQEIVLDVFLKIWNNTPVLNIARSLDGYLYRSVVNAGIDFNKAEARKSEKHKEFITGFEETGIDDDSNEKLENRLKLIEYALKQLPPQCKKVMVMSKFEKYKQQEIANKLNISVKTVKNHLSYGYKKIEAFLINNHAFLWFLFFFVTI